MCKISSFSKRSHSTNHSIHVCNTYVPVSSATEATTTSTTTTKVTSTFTTQNISILLPLQPGRITVLCVINYNKPTIAVRVVAATYNFCTISSCYRMFQLLRNSRDVSLSESVTVNSLAFLVYRFKLLVWWGRLNYRFLVLVHTEISNFIIIIIIVIIIIEQFLLDMS